MSVLTYDGETWTFSHIDMPYLTIFESKILRKILGPVQDFMDIFADRYVIP